MKKSYLITLTAICMMTGMSLLEANTVTITNNTSYPITVALKTISKTTHAYQTINLSAATGNTPTTTRIYEGGVETITVTNTTNTSNQQTATKGVGNTHHHYSAKTITISDSATTPGTPVIAATE